jgi:trafficking protein particle complex subunit 2
MPPVTGRREASPPVAGDCDTTEVAVLGVDVEIEAVGAARMREKGTVVDASLCVNRDWARGGELSAHLAALAERLFSTGTSSCWRGGETCGRRDRKQKLSVEEREREAKWFGAIQIVNVIELASFVIGRSATYRQPENFPAACCFSIPPTILPSQRPTCLVIYSCTTVVRLYEPRSKSVLGPIPRNASMALNSSPAIACIGVLSKHDQPLHISLLPPHNTAPNASLEFLFLLNSCLDIFDLRARTTKLLDSDLGLLQAIDERLACYGWLTNTGIKFIIVVDMMGRPAPNPADEDAPKDKRRFPPTVGLREAELKPAFRAVQTAYVHLMLNPFYMPDERTPLQVANYGGKSPEITSKKFINEIQRIGKAWYPGIGAI